MDRPRRNRKQPVYTETKVEEEDPKKEVKKNRARGRPKKNAIKIEDAEEEKPAVLVEDDVVDIGEANTKLSKATTSDNVLKPIDDIQVSKIKESKKEVSKTEESKTEKSRPSKVKGKDNNTRSGKSRNSRKNSKQCKEEEIEEVAENESPSVTTENTENDEPKGELPREKKSKKTTKTRRKQSASDKRSRKLSRKDTEEGDLPSDDVPVCLDVPIDEVPADEVPVCHEEPTEEVSKDEVPVCHEVPTDERIEEEVILEEDEMKDDNEDGRKNATTNGAVNSTFTVDDQPTEKVNLKEQLESLMGIVRELDGRVTKLEEDKRTLTDQLQKQQETFQQGVKDMTKLTEIFTQSLDTRFKQMEERIAKESANGKKHPSDIINISEGHCREKVDDEERGGSLQARLQDIKVEPLSADLENNMADSSKVQWHDEVLILNEFCLRQKKLIRKLQNAMDKNVTVPHE